MDENILKNLDTIYHELSDPKSPDKPIQDWVNKNSANHDRLSGKSFG